MSRSIVTIISAFAIGILVVVAGFFLLDIEKVALNFWAFGSLLFSLAASLLVTLMLVAPKKNNETVFYTAGLSSTIWIYEVVVVISLLFTQKFADHLGRFIFLQIAINALFFVAVMIMIAASERIHDSNAGTYEKLQNVEHNKPKRGRF